MGYIRDDIDNLFVNNTINFREKSILITSLIYAIDKIANTVGHYDAFRKSEDLSSKLFLLLPNLEDDFKDITILNDDANIVATKIKCDICYIGPPYNSRQYCDAYHFLENISQNKKPKVFGVAKKMDRNTLKSEYSKKNAKYFLADLIEKINAKYILLSYNSTGNSANARSNAKISDDEILEILNKKGKTQIFSKEFTLFSTEKTKATEHSEKVFFFEVNENKNYEKISSPLNYTGGKYKLLDQIIPLFPKNIKTFYDIFCGGFNVGGNMKVNCVVGIDSNEQLINLLNYLKNSNYSQLFNDIEEKIKFYNLSNTFKFGYECYDCNSQTGLSKFNKNRFLHLRDDYNKTKDNLLFLLLIFYSFNNQIRFNKSNHFNLPVGKRYFNKNMREKLKKFLEHIQNKDVCFSCNDFRNLDLDKFDKSDFLYCDPPYLLGNASYNETNLWNEQDDKDLFNFSDDCNKRGIKFALSNVIEHKGNINKPLIEWCKINSYTINKLNYNYHNSNYQNKFKNTKTQEVLITNY